MEKDTFKLTPQSLKDIGRLKKESSKLVGKVLLLIGDIMIHPFEGIGKPEALKGDLAGYWSRRIDQKHTGIIMIAKPYRNFLSFKIQSYDYALIFC